MIPANSQRVLGSVIKDIVISNANRRDSDRIPWRAGIAVQPLNDDLVEVGEPFSAIASDISREGVGFIVATPIQTRFLRITQRESGLAMFAQVIHCSDIGDDYPQYLVGTIFLES